MIYAPVSQLFLVPVVEGPLISLSNVHLSFICLQLQIAP